MRGDDKIQKKDYNNSILQWKYKKKIGQFVEKFQKKILEKDIEKYNDYILNLFHNPKNWGKPQDNRITISQSFKGPCGDSMHFFLKINKDIIEKANFITEGCCASVATASQTTLLIEGKSLDFAEKLKARDIDFALKGLPDEHKHCADFAVKTLKYAIEGYNKQKFDNNWMTKNRKKKSSVHDYNQKLQNTNQIF